MGSISPHPKAMPTGVTTWIKGTLLKGVPFSRRGCSGMGSPDKGLKSGRKIDLAFKEYCVTRQVPAGSLPWVKRRIAAIQMSLRKAKVEVTASNVFVSLGQLKTHLDGVGIYRPTGETVVLELKSTTSSLQDHRRAYDVACSLQPTVKVGRNEATNTERLHHAIQLAFGVHALKSATRGYVIISASDGAALYPLNRGIPLEIFAQAIPQRQAVAPSKSSSKSKRKKSVGKSKKTAASAHRWPGAKVALPGWKDFKRITSSVWMVQQNSTVALATAVSSKKGQAAGLARLKEIQAKLDNPPRVLLTAMPSNKRWICHRNQN